MVGEPGGEGVRGKDAEVGGHAEVAEAAELGAEDGVGAGSGGGEVNVDVLTVAGVGHGVLFEAEGGDGEAVNDILGVEAKVDLAACGKDELGGDEVVGSAGVGRVEAEGIAFAWGDELRARLAEGGVLAGIAEVPGELHTSGFDLERGEVGAGVAGGSPEALGTEGEEDEEEGQRGEGNIFDQRLIAGFSAGFPVKKQAN